MKSRASFAPRALVLGAAVLGLAACANPQADQALYAQRAFIGMPKQTLLSCAGVPERQTVVDNVEYYTYSSERVTTRHVSAGIGYGHGFGWGWHRPWWGLGYGYGFGAPLVPDVETKSCEATFTLKDGTVQQVVYGGSTDSAYGRLGQCYTIVQNCLALIPGQGAPAR